MTPDDAGKTVIPPRAASREAARIAWLAQDLPLAGGIAPPGGFLGADRRARAGGPGGA